MVSSRTATITQQHACAGRNHPPLLPASRQKHEVVILHPLQRADGADKHLEPFRLRHIHFEAAESYLQASAARLCLFGMACKLPFHAQGSLEVRRERSRQLGNPFLHPLQNQFTEAAGIEGFLNTQTRPSHQYSLRSSYIPATAAR